MLKKIDEELMLAAWHPTIVCDCCIKKIVSNKSVALVLEEG